MGNENSLDKLLAWTVSMGKCIVTKHRLLAEQGISRLTRPIAQKARQIQFQVAQKSGRGIASLKEDLDLTKEQLKQLADLKKDLQKELYQLGEDAKIE